eukprot:comp14223_c0_seq1/m.10206 comp14223_c0_seq1/g.10206  ORF comp14223_c0_seq1/g.10206 comp14223_c0_seq1/m.10206 type:complete len:108 (-) comp14223_c0_seq1:438-761(-)
MLVGAANRRVQAGEERITMMGSDLVSRRDRPPPSNKPPLSAFPVLCSNLRATRENPVLALNQVTKLDYAVLQMLLHKEPNPPFSAREQVAFLGSRRSRAHGTVEHNK